MESRKTPHQSAYKRPDARQLEIAVSSTRSLLAAIAGGADRIELCTALSLGGLTPDQAWLEWAVQYPVPILVMVRPRPGNFVYSSSDLSLMKQSIRLAHQAGVSGVVSGALTPLGRVDQHIIRALLDEAGDMPFTFHRAFDGSVDPLKDLEVLMKLGVTRLLSAGGMGPANPKILHNYQKLASDQLGIVVAGSIRSNTIQALLAEVNLMEFHSAGTIPDKKMENLTTAYPQDPIADQEEIRLIKKAILAEALS